MVLNPDFKEFVQSLNDNQVRYLVIGGYAVALHGHPRYTKDLDLWIECSQENAVKIVTIDEIEMNFIDLDNLKKNKRATGRLQDLADIENLES